jgi:GNAT superfamily N-acetyltransferase
MRGEDIPAGLRLCRAASWNQLAADWEVFLTANADGCRVAMNETGEVIGTVATISYGNAFSWIAMVLVDPAYRRSGIGTRLLNESLAIVGDATARLDATPAGHHVYVPLGFREEYGLVRMTWTAIAEQRGRENPSRRDYVRRMTSADLVGVSKEDLDVFGADRRMLLERLHARAPEYAWVIGGDRIDGYLFGRHGYSFEQLGPLVARDESSARRLVATCTAANAERSFVIDAPLQPSWTGWLESVGFTVQRPFTRMCRGLRPFHERRDRMFAIAGPEFG